MPCPYPEGLLRLAPLPPPLLPKEVNTLPHGEDWIYEFLWGGERVRAVKHEAGAQLLSRDNRDITNRFPRVAAAVAKLRFATAVIDGEILHLSAYPEPATRFLEQASDEPAGGGIAFLVYDLLNHEGKDIRQFPLLCRRLLLSSVVQGTPLILSPLIDGNSEAALAASARLGFRGVMAKRAGSPYRPNSLATDWLKTTFAPLPREALARLATPTPFAKHNALGAAPVPVGAH